jgi:hypothetical protein
MTVWSTIVAATSIVICGIGAAWFVHRRELSALDSELRADSAHFYSELERHGGSKFDWRRIDGEMREWMPQRYPPRYAEVRTGDTIRWRSKNMPADGLPKQPDGIGELQVGGKALRLFRSEQKRWPSLSARKCNRQNRSCEGCFSLFSPVSLLPWRSPGLGEGG